MRSTFMFAPLLLALTACVPAQTAATPSASPADAFLKLGQVWDVQAKTADGKTESYTIALKNALDRKSDGSISYVDVARRLTLIYDPKGSSSEFLVMIGLAATPDLGDIPMCIIPNPSKAADQTAFQGRFAVGFMAGGLYMSEGKTDDLGTCTLTLRKP